MIGGSLTRNTENKRKGKETGGILSQERSKEGDSIAAVASRSRSS